MKKALVVATVGRFLGFEKNNIELLKSMGYEVHCATNCLLDEMDDVSYLNIRVYQIPFSRMPLRRTNWKAYRTLKKLIEKENYELIHCHTPVGGILTRIAARKYRRKGKKIIYTAHGFHFFKGAQWKNWILYYPAEWICSWWTDVLLTINAEDYEFAQKHLHAHKVEKIPGVGIDVQKYAQCRGNREKLREQFGVAPDEYMLLSVGELSFRKNQEIILRAIAQMKDSKIKYFIAGEGAYRKRYEQFIVEHNIENQVYLLGQVKDVVELYHAADLFVFPSRQEGLPVALMEAMASGIDIICSDIRGNRDLIDDSLCLVDDNSVEKYIEMIRKHMSMEHRNVIKLDDIEQYSFQSVQKRMEKIYVG